MRQLSLVALLVLGGFSAMSEIAVHWWPAGNGAWSPRAYPLLMEFQDNLLLIGGQFREYVEDWEDGTILVTWDQRDVWQSTDGQNWHYLTDYYTLPYPPRIRAAKKDDALLLLGEYGGYLCRLLSTHNGVDWRTLTINVPTCGGTGFAAFAGALWVHRVFQDDTGDFGRDIWRSEDGTEWSPIVPTGALPGRTYHLMELDGELMAIGLRSSENGVSGDGFSWSRLSPEEDQYDFAEMHPPLQAKGKIWLLGHATDAHTFQVVNSEDGRHWEVIVSDPPFPLRARFGAVAWKDRIWICGGLSGGQELNDIWYTEDTPEEIHRADYDADGKVSLSELLRVIQFFQAGRYQCDGTTEDSYAPGPGWETCYPHSSDYLPQDWRIGLSELLRAVQFYNVGSYHACPDAATEDGYCPGAG